MTNKEKDVADYLKEKKQLENKISELQSKKSLLPTEEVIISEVKGRLNEVVTNINRLSNNY